MTTVTAQKRLNPFLKNTPGRSEITNYEFVDLLRVHNEMVEKMLISSI